MAKPAAGWKKGRDANRGFLLSTPPKKIAEENEEPLKKQRLDPLTDRLGCTHYQQGKRWPWFLYEYGGVTYPLDVTRFYPERNLALDIKPQDRNLCALKSKMLREQGINYSALESVHDLDSLVIE